MTDPLILHPYEVSPFSEKIRRILAWKGLPVVRREDPPAGVVFVHFPRIGFVVSAA